MVALNMPGVCRLFSRRKLVILLYHGFTDEQFQGIRNNQGKHVHIEKFRRQLAFLTRHYNIVPLRQAVDYCGGRGSLADNSVVITMDDGYESNYSLAWPVLREFDAPASIFITTGFVDAGEFLWTDRLEYAIDTTSADKVDFEVNGARHHFSLSDRLQCYRQINLLFKSLPQERLAGAMEQLERATGTRLGQGAVPAIYRPLTWEQVREMAREGLVSFGAHTRSHVVMGRCTTETVRAETTGSKATVERHLGVPCDLFCYPNGQPGDFNDLTENILRENGFVCGLTTVEGMNGPGSNVYELRRFQVTDGRSHDEFILNVAGVLTVMKRIRQRVCAGVMKSGPVVAKHPED